MYKGDDTMRMNGTLTIMITLILTRKDIGSAFLFPGNINVNAITEC